MKFIPAIACYGFLVVLLDAQQVPNVPPQFQPETVTVGLAWDNAANPAPFTVIRRGIVPGVYTEMVVLASTKTTYNWTNAPAFSTNYFAAFHRNEAGLESVPSNEVSWKPTGGRVLPPTMNEPTRVTAMFKVKAPVSFEQVRSDEAGATKLHLFVPNKNGEQNVLVTSTEGAFRISEKPMLGKLMP